MRILESLSQSRFFPMHVEAANKKNIFHWLEQIMWVFFDENSTFWKLMTHAVHDKLQVFHLYLFFVTSLFAQVYDILWQIFLYADKSKQT